MRLTTLAYLQCAECRGALSPEHSYLRSTDPEPLAGERLTNGAVLCPHCGARFPVQDGLLDLRPASRQGDPDPHKLAQERFFTREAEGYERDVVNSPFYQALDDLTVHRWGASLTRGSVVLEVGAGTGRVAIRLAERGHYVVAIDLTEALLRRLQQKASEARVEVDVVLADAELLPVADGALDAVVVHGVLHHLTSPDVVIGQAGRALREGGRWFSLDPHRSPLRGVFDAAMRALPLWKEEAAPDALQTEERLLSWCKAAGISATAAYNCYVLPHFVTWMPRGAARAVLRATDEVMSRSVARRLAGVISVWGRKGRHGLSGESESSRTLRAVVLLAIVLAARAWQTDPTVALNSDAYYMGSIEQMLETVNAPVQWGALMVRASGDPLEARQLDDMGYALGLQAFSAAAGPLSGRQVAALHQIAYVVAALVFAWTIGARFRSTLAAAAVLILLIVLGRRLAMLLYGQVSNQTITSIFPMIVVAALSVWSDVLTSLRSTRRALLWTGAVGALVGAIDLTRHSHGLAALLTAALVLALGVSGVRRRIQLAGSFAAGFLLLMIVVPGAARLHRDITLGRYDGWSWSYVQKPPQHDPYYTLLTAIGRYPNSLGLFYEDRSVDAYIRAHAPGKAGPIEEVVDASRGLWRDYIRQYPGEYARGLVAGAFELPAFIAYTTFMAERRWTFAWPAIAGDINVDSRDVARYGSRLLMNVRYRYLRLEGWQWLVLAAAWAAIIGSVVAVIRGGPALRAHRLLIGSAVVYLALVAVPRAIVPVQGMDLIFAFWSVVLLCGVFLFRVYPPLRAAR